MTPQSSSPTPCEHYERTCVRIESSTYYLHHVYACDNCGDEARDSVLKAQELLDLEGAA